MENRDEIELVPVFDADDESTAEIVRGLLEAEGIPAIVRVHEPILEAGILPEPGIWGHIFVREDQAEKAREIIEAYRASAPTKGTE